MLFTIVAASQTCLTTQKKKRKKREKTQEKEHSTAAKQGGGEKCLISTRTPRHFTGRGFSEAGNIQAYTVKINILAKLIKYSIGYSDI